MRKNKIVWDYTKIVIGAFLMAVATTVFYDANSMVTGGVTGLAIVVKAFLGIPLWLTNIVLNVPLFIWGIKENGKGFFLKTFIATAILSLMLWLTKLLPAFEMGNDLALVAVFGGAIGGAGLGLVFSAGATTGGSDLAASIIHNYMKHVAVSKIMFIIDALVILLGFFVFGHVIAMYAIISVFIYSWVVDAILEGLSFAKAAFIISDSSEEISKVIMDELGRGITGLSGRGMYTGRRKDVALCVVSNKELVRLKEIARSIDENAFIIVADVREVLGEGFSDI